MKDRISFDGQEHFPVYNWEPEQRLERKEPEPIHCDCCPNNPVLMALRKGNRITIRLRKHGQDHYATLLLDKREQKE